jgi:hypothetical protein
VCIELSVGSPWLDTVDQEHIPLRISNSCDREILVELEVTGPQGTIQKVSRKIPGNSSQELDIVMDIYLKKVVIKGKWKDEDWREIPEVELILR